MSQTQMLLSHRSGNLSQHGEIRLGLETPSQVRNASLIVDFLNFSCPHLAYSFIYPIVSWKGLIHKDEYSEDQLAQASQGNFMEKAVWELLSDDEEDVDMQKKGGV